MSLPPLRPARPEEAEALAALVGRAYAAYLPVIGRRPAPMDDDYAARIAAGRPGCWRRRMADWPGCWCWRWPAAISGWRTSRSIRRGSGPASAGR
ncbi:hypothetical protein [Teichococcus aestuarii]|uniref:hypothetical protein n=1 Tax=Teichococcus aestuarii TaxID=568898 RepID=UPI0036097170